MVGKYRIERLDIASVEFPQRLRDIPDPPKQLYFAGDVSLLKKKSIAVVGSRRHTVYGKNVALMIGRSLGERGIAVTSGLALGIDAYSHEGALEEGGRIIGVLGSGIDMMGPKRNYNLMIKGLDAGGLIISEYEPGFAAHAGTFPMRNRIISGIAEAIIVVEAGMNSGSLITANHALAQGRPIYAVPGPINSQYSIGCNLLIKDGATPFVLMSDMIRDLNLGACENKSAVSAPKLDSDELEIYEVISQMGGATIDEIVDKTGKSAALVNAASTIMEIKGIIETYAGRIYISK